MILHMFLTALFLMAFAIIPFLINVPLALYHVHRLREGRVNFEPTDVFRQMPYRKRESFVKLGFFLLSFFYYLFRTVATLVS